MVRRLRGSGAYSRGEHLDHLDCGSCRFGVDLSGEVLNDLDADEMAEPSASLGEFRAVLVEYQSVECIRELVLRVLVGMNGFLDTDFGELLPDGEVLQRFREDSSWDWRIR